MDRLRLLTVVCISDTHSHHDRLPLLPEADVLLHTGDWMSEDPDVVPEVPFVEWFRSQPYRYKILVPGNHDAFERTMAISDPSSGVFVLNSSCALVDGFFFFGFPNVRSRFTFCDFEAPFAPDDRSSIPSSTDVLLSHDGSSTALQRDDITCPTCLESFRPRRPRPPEAHLSSEVDRTQPLLHVFGHVHATPAISTQNDTTLLVNASIYRELGDEGFHLHPPSVVTFRREASKLLVQRLGPDLQVTHQLSLFRPRLYFPVHSCVRGSPFLTLGMMDSFLAFSTDSTPLLFRFELDGLLLEQTTNRYLHVDLESRSVDLVSLDAVDRKDVTRWVYFDDFLCCDTERMMMLSLKEVEAGVVEGGRLVIREMVPNKRQKWRFSILE